MSTNGAQDATLALVGVATLTTLACGIADACFSFKSDYSFPDQALLNQSDPTVAAYEKALAAYAATKSTDGSSVQTLAAVPLLGLANTAQASALTAYGSAVSAIGLPPTSVTLAAANSAAAALAAANAAANTSFTAVSTPALLSGVRIGTASANVVALVLAFIALGLYYGVLPEKGTQFNSSAPHAAVWIAILASFAGLMCNFMLAYPATQDLASRAIETPSTLAGGSVNLILGAASALAFAGAVFMR